ncbi:MAG: hypothetical protein NVS9B12_03770 [Vulcanimicrobiaceae bacterium]
MMISAGTQRALAEITRRQQDLHSAFTPAAEPSHSEVMRPAQAVFSLDPLSVAAPVQAYFISADERGRQTYSRDGAFHLSENTLVDRFERPVLGFRRPGEPLAPLQVNALDAALGRARDVQIAHDGTVSYTRTSIDPQTGTAERARVAVGRVGLARFTAGTHLPAVDATRFLAPAGVAAHIGVPADGNFGDVVANRSEQSRIDFDLGVEKLRDAYLAFDALRAAHSAQGRAEKTAMDLLK